MKHIGRLIYGLALCAALTGLMAFVLQNLAFVQPQYASLCITIVECYLVGKGLLA